MAYGGRDVSLPLDRPWHSRRDGGVSLRCCDGGMRGERFGQDNACEGSRRGVPPAERSDNQGRQSALTAGAEALELFRDAGRRLSTVCGERRRRGSAWPTR